MNKSISYFLSGILIGVFVATIGFAVYQRSLISSKNNKSSNQIVLKLGHGLDSKHPVHKSIEFMKQRLEELSGGRVTIDIYPSSVLGTETQCIEQLQNGSLAMTKTSVAAMENFIPEMAAFSFPYIFKDSDHYWRVLKSDLGKELLAKGEKKYLKGLCYYDAGSRNFYTNKVPIRKPEDLEGLKIRVLKSATAMNMMRAFGAYPTPIAWGELYSSLAQGTVDGAENNPPSYTTNKHYEVCKYFTLDGHTRIPDILLISTKVWDTLDTQVQGWIQEAADESSDYERKLWEKKTKESLAEAKAEGVEIINVDVPAFAEKVAPMLDSVENPKVKTILKRIKGVQ